jgi:hypothetical protein
MRRCADAPMRRCADAVSEDADSRFSSGLVRFGEYQAA